MNILVIGNGFDLAHGLPTKYGDFLEFVDDMERYCFKKGKRVKSNSKIEKYLEKGFISEILEELGSCIHDNVWLEHFRKIEIRGGWIDFEREIRKSIERIDKDVYIGNNTVRKKGKVNGLFNIIDNNFDKGLKRIKINPRLFYRFAIPYENQQKSLFDIEYDNKIQEDLDKLIRALEIYLLEYVEKLDCDKILPDIANTSFDAILSFNYTHTYMKLYDPSGECEYNYIHGETNSAGSMQTNNMVLGIDEYLSDERKDRDLDYIAFKKYYQRIYKGTGSEYKKWLNQIQNKYVEYLENKNKYLVKVKQSKDSGNGQMERNCLINIRELDEQNKVNNIFIFGHSLDETDKDILRNLILCDNVHTTIYYHKIYDENGKDDNGRIDLGSKIANLVKVIGQDELIRRTGGNTKTIEFKLQQDMVARS